MFEVGDRIIFPEDVTFNAKGLNGEIEPYTIEAKTTGTVLSIDKVYDPFILITTTANKYICVMEHEIHVMEL